MVCLWVTTHKLNMMKIQDTAGMTLNFQHRREFLAGAAGVGLASVSGCLGEGDDNGDNNGDVVDEDGSVDMRIGSSTEGSTVYQTSQALQRVLDQQSDLVDWNTQTTGGDPGSIRLYDQGELEAYGLENRIVRQAIAGDDPFEEEMDVPYQGFGYFLRDDHFVAVDGSGIETTDDLLGADVHLLEPGWGTRELVFEVFQEDEELFNQLTENVVDIDTGDVAGAVEEGQVEAMISYGNNDVNLPSWMQEVDARTDIYHIEMTDQFRNVIEQSPIVPHFEKDTYGYEQDMGSDTFEGWQIPFQYYISPDIPSEHVYELLEVCEEHYESVQEGQPAFFPYGEDPQYFVGSLDDHVPVHPGAADFYEDRDVWNDDWERGEESDDD